MSRQGWPWCAGAAVLAAAALLAAGCSGYQLGPTKPAAYAAVESIAVPNFRNDTLEPRISVMVTNAVIGEFQTDGTYRVTGRGNADAILEATIISINREQARSTRSDTLRAREIEYTLEVDYVFRQVSTGRVLSEGTVFGSADQFLGNNVQLTERQALPLAASRLARNLVSELSEGW